MSETETKPESKWKRLPKNSILRRMEKSNPEMRVAFEEWVRDLPLYGEGQAYWLGVTRPFEVHAKNWKISHYDETWAQIVAVCRTNPTNISVIQSEIFPGFTPEAAREAKRFFEVDMAVARFDERQRALPPEPIEVHDMVWEHEKVLFNASIKVLDAMRQYDTIEEQAEALAHSIAAAAYVVAHTCSEDPLSTTWVWVKGRDRAVERGVENSPPEAGTYVFHLPDLNMQDVVLAAWGDCPAADRLRADLGGDDVEAFQITCRHLSTVGGTTLSYGTQPSWPEYRLD
ncbi:MAG: hypothetical protein Q7T93_13335 [Methylobacterium sp.]|uniref:hypothetical protein n=1 Tax=Methylobacterium sp. TaxID=409 RepID=UPI00271C278F|nr:hypothetical protein [Methylobacterium sp.]MDO9427800.1 hypothetical protein [Methylobacterium sp.]